jgi:hypothetical protein
MVAVSEKRTLVVRCRLGCAGVSVLCAAGSTEFSAAGNSGTGVSGASTCAGVSGGIENGFGKRATADSDSPFLWLLDEAREDRRGDLLVEDEGLCVA